ncbi:MAG: prepilin-type N-terminal cleavage/methylation domain-containing protein [Thermodesulfobacteriota bacterium]
MAAYLEADDFRPGSIGSRGMTLMEVMVAMALLAMVTMMVYSILDRALVFAHKGEGRIVQLERDSALLNLLSRQVRSGWYDSRSKGVVIVADDNVLRLITKAPLLYPENGTVLATYYLLDDALYYDEHKDFFNPEHLDGALDPEEMTQLLADAQGLHFDYEGGAVLLTWQEQEYELWPWCTEEEEDE